MLFLPSANLFFFKINFFKKFFQEHYQSVKRLGSKLFAKVISRLQKLPLARKELNCILSIDRSSAGMKMICCKLPFKRPCQIDDYCRSCVPRNVNNKVADQPTLLCRLLSISDICLLESTIYSPFLSKFSRI